MKIAILGGGIGKALAAALLASLALTGCEVQVYEDSEGRRYDSQRALTKYSRDILHVDDVKAFEYCLWAETEEGFIDAEDVAECSFKADRPRNRDRYEDDDDDRYEFDDDDYGDSRGSLSPRYNPSEGQVIYHQASYQAVNQVGNVESPPEKALDTDSQKADAIKASAWWKDDPQAVLNEAEAYLQESHQKVIEAINGSPYMVRVSFWQVLGYALSASDYSVTDTIDSFLNQNVEAVQKVIKAYEQSITL